MASLAKEPYVTPVVEVDYSALTNLEPDGSENDLTGVDVLEMGLGWDKSTGGHGGVIGWLSRKAGSDLDGNAVFYTAPQKPIKYLGWDELDSFANEPAHAGSAVHTGDNQTGEGAGDDETIRIEFAKLPPRIKKIVLTAAAFKPGSSMKRAKNITVTLYDSTGGTKTPVAYIEPSLLRPKNTIGCAVLTRQPATPEKPEHWTLRVLDASVDVKQGDRDDFLVKNMQF